MQVVPLALICVGFDFIFHQASAAPGDFDIVDYQYRDGKTLQVAKCHCLTQKYDSRQMCSRAG